MHHQTRINLLLLGPACVSRIAVLIAVMLAQAGLAGRTEAAPNVLFVISDDLTATALSCYGPTQCQPPHIARLARRGVRLRVPIASTRFAVHPARR